MLAAMYMSEEKVLVITNDTRDYSQAAILTVTVTVTVTLTPTQTRTRTLSPLDATPTSSLAVTYL